MYTFYARYQPAKIENVPKLLAKFKGKEQKLHESLKQKYGLAPEALIEPPGTEEPVGAKPTAAPAEAEAEAAPAEAQEPLPGPAGVEAPPSQPDEEGGGDNAAEPAPEVAAAAVTEAAAGAVAEVASEAT